MKGSSLFVDSICHLPLYLSFGSNFAWFFSLLFLCFWALVWPINNLILTPSSCFIKGLSLFEASFIYFVLYISFWPYFAWHFEHSSILLWARPPTVKYHFLGPYSTLLKGSLLFGGSSCDLLLYLTFRAIFACKLSPICVHCLAFLKTVNMLVLGLPWICLHMSWSNNACLI